MKNPITEEEYNILLSSFKSLENRQEILRQAHIDANNEGDQRECDAWSVTDSLSKQNYQRMKEISDFLLGTKIIERVDTGEIYEGTLLRMLINGKMKEYFFCYPITLQFISNGISGSSRIGEEIRGKEKGFKKTIVLKNGEDLQVEILEVINN